MQDPLFTLSDDMTNSRMSQAARQHEVLWHTMRNKIRYVQMRNYFDLQLIRRQLSQFPPGMITLIPASRWLFDNYYLLYRDLKEFQAGGGAGRFRRLPVIKNGPSKGYPRIYLIAREMIASANLHLDEDSVISMVREYQTVKNLKTAEINLLPDILSFCLRDRIIEESKKIIPAIKNKIRVDNKMNQIASLFIKDENKAFSLLKASISKADFRNSAISSHLIYRLKGLSLNQQDIAAFIAVLLGIEKEEGTKLLLEITEKERISEAKTESVFSALMTSLKEISDLDHEHYFNSVSILETTLGEDPDGVYANMDEPTRARYRQAVEKAADHFKTSELSVARSALNLSGSPPGNTIFPAPRHVGTYLVGHGRPYLRAALSGKPAKVKDRSFILNLFRRSSYFAGILLITIMIIGFIGLMTGMNFSGMPLNNLVMLLAMLIPASGAAVFIVNNLFTRLVMPKITMAMNFEKAIPDTCRTFVVMPVILASPASARRCAAALERHYLANRKSNLFFALLVDFKDAHEKTLAEDAQIIRMAEQEITALNQKYQRKNLVFSLFYREREWNQAQNCWMGRERKRGKLEDFNALLIGEPESSYLMPVSDSSVFSTIKYVITLDADTEMPHESAAKLISVIEHPLNQPFLDHTGCRVIAGYAIVQSEVGNRIPGPSAGIFQRVLSGLTGFDPYATIVSDIYQDTFDEGIYAGKGIYHLKTFHQLLYQRIPDNQVLSHDLLEGSLTRCAFASGIKLVDKVPSSIDAYIRREHRWIRGDWQLVPYIFGKSSINLLSRWKMLDNLRRSLMHPARIFLILCNIFLFPQAPWIWLLFLFYEPAVRMATTIIGLVAGKARHLSARISYSIVGRAFADTIMQSLYSFVLLPVRAYLALDAICRTLYRLAISRKNLLEWQTAESVEKSADTSLKDYIRQLWPSYPMAAVLLFSLTLPASWPYGILVALLSSLWLLSPAIASMSGRPVSQRKHNFPTADQTSQLRLQAVKIWCYFDDFSDAEHHWLCPDHYQENPGPITENKTSPTNIGLQLLAYLSARDLGYLGLLSFVNLSEKILSVISSLPTWHGHLYNWYDRRTLQIIEPQYISTVDSGNFIAHLITLKNGLLSILQKPIYSETLNLGLNDLRQMDRSEGDGTGTQRAAAEATSGSPADGPGCLYRLAEDAAADSQTGKRTRKLCMSLVEDKDHLAGGQMADLLKTPKELADGGNTDAAVLIGRIGRMIADIDELVDHADFQPLYDAKKHLFHIGYHVSLQKLDRGHYDLMASEARLASFIAIAKGDLPKRHWLSLGRPLTLVRGIPALVSWSGSMFEYLMPNLVMRVPRGSVLRYSCAAAVASQIQYGRKMDFPWGISESQYFIFDNQGNYQYGPFGVGRLRLQPRLKPVKVIAPYATLLALGTAPRKAIKNMRALQKAGAGGRYGFYEALDYSSPDSGSLKKYSLVRCFMTHHLGMSLAAINNLLYENVLQARFHSEPMIRANEILLEETFTSPLVTIASLGYTIDVNSKETQQEDLKNRLCNTTHTPYPLATVLSNGHYQLMLTTRGDGFSSCDDIMINRWRPDQHDGGSGLFVYVRETGSGHLWSNTYLPAMAKPDSYQVIFSHDKAEYLRKDGQVTTYTEITISPVDQLEIRRVTLTNHSEQPVKLELTSYLEVVADHFMADVSHPAFSKLFIETKYDQDRNLLVATRRPRSPDEQNGYVMHMVRTEEKPALPVSFETSRQTFIGRGGSLMMPDALASGRALSGKAGTPIDPILSLQVVLAVPPGRKAVVSFITGYCPSMAAVVNLHEKMSAKFSDDDIFNISRTSSLLEIEYLKIRSEQLNAIQNLVGALYYPTQAFRNEKDALSRNRLGQPGLWRFGISGDQPVMLLRIADTQDLAVLKDVLLAYEYLRLQRVRTDLVILNEAEVTYRDDLQQLIFEQTSTIRVYEEGRYHTGIYVLRASQISAEEKDLLLTVARIIFTPQTGIYFRKLDQAWPEDATNKTILLPAGEKPITAAAYDYMHHGEPVPEFFNGIGGFVCDGREYEIRLGEGHKTPAPWINVIANERFGCQISEIGAGYTWAGNSRENKLTTWSNDPVLDPVSEAVYVRDQKSGAIASPCALVPGAEGHFTVRHGFGYSVFERREANLDQSMTVFVSADQPVKLMILNLRNKTQEPLDLTVSYFAEWVLGAFREQTSRYILTAFDPAAQILTARNVYHDAGKEGIAFQFASEPVTSFTGDRLSFIGEGGTVRFPFGLTGENLSGQIGAGMDPCGAIQCKIHIAPKTSKTIVFGLGQADRLEKAADISARLRSPADAQHALKTVRQFWDKLPGNMTVRTPDRAMDILMNGWLLYQVLSCRLRAKAAFYQCGGAFGFRDQLQDVLAMMDFDSSLTKNHILLCCSRQFTEGDVQHWWHEPDGVGVRTRISDDLLWLPYAAAEYLRHTGDQALLDEQVSFLEENLLSKGQRDLVSKPLKTLQTGAVYAHCILAIDYACRFGRHGLPLMKDGDWNDGMNLVGPEEQGESVWLGWFLYSVLQKFIPICRSRGEHDRADHYQQIAGSLTNAIEKHAWDGEWYLRAFFDNGQPLGSAQNSECRIDSISQSWAVISGAADKNRAALALRSAERHLVNAEEGLVLLLAPPFDKSNNHPGYIKGYSPGIRENGGQYTHAAVWLAMACCGIGDGSEAYRLFNMINPIHTTSDFRSLSRYEREPYVMTADVSYEYPNTGKGGWSWYTGAAGWLYRAILNNFLGVRKEGRQLVLEPCVSASFQRYQIEYRFGRSLYEITVLNQSNTGNKISSMQIDGIAKEGNRIDLIDDGAVRHIEIKLGQ